MRVSAPSFARIRLPPDRRPLPCPVCEGRIGGLHMRIGVLTGGGDAPGLNAAIRAVARAGWRERYQIVGIRNGWLGLLNDDVVELTPEDVRGILHRGGTILGTSRTNPFKVEGGPQRILDRLRARGIDALVAIGGDDTLSVAQKLFELGVRVVGIPKTMDNDISGTDYTIGFDTAVNVVMDACDKPHRHRHADYPGGPGGRVRARAAGRHRGRALATDRGAHGLRDPRYRAGTPAARRVADGG